MMTLDEAIEHCKELAAQGDGNCSLEHGQLLKWLGELREIKNRRKMKIIVYKDLENDCILQVASMEYYKGVKKTEADVEKAITEFNMTHPNQQYVTLECTEEVYEAICFILGERQYSKAHNLDDIFFRLTGIRDAVCNIRELTESMQSDLLTTMDDIDTKIQEIKKPKKR